MQRIINRLCSVILALASTVAVAGMATDVNEANERGAEVRSIIDGYIKSDQFSMPDFLAELHEMPTTAPLALVYLVEFDAALADEAFGGLIEDFQDLVVSAIVLAAKGKSPAMCPMVKAAARQSKAAATESIVAISTEAPNQTGGAVKCAKSENVVVNGLGSVEGDVEIQFGGDDPATPISPN